MSHLIEYLMHECNAPTISPNAMGVDLYLGKDSVVARPANQESSSECTRSGNHDLSANQRRSNIGDDLDYPPSNACFASSDKTTLLLV